jgi:hypothetical protein
MTQVPNFASVDFALAEGANEAGSAPPWLTPEGIR